MKYKALTFFCSILVIFAGICTGEEPDPDYMKISMMLFPETGSWIPVNQMKKAGGDYLRKHKKELQSAYFWKKLHNASEDEDCSFINRAFSEEYGFPEYFYTHDINSDGYMDILYTGSVQCAEGDSTLIWFGTANGFTIQQDILWPMLAIRVLPNRNEQQIRISSVAVGCCASETDEYFIGYLFNFRNLGIRNITTTTFLPQSIQTPVRFLSPDSELVLRSTPLIDDHYDESGSGLMGLAVFGNVLSKYLPGCSGEIIAQQTDHISKLWYFVIIDDQSGVLRTHAPFNVSAGWVNATGITLVQ